MTEMLNRIHRRDFLRGVGAAAGVALLGPFLPKSVKAEPEVVKYGVPRILGTSPEATISGNWHNMRKLDIAFDDLSPHFGVDVGNHCPRLVHGSTNPEIKLGFGLSAFTDNGEPLNLVVTNRAKREEIDVRVIVTGNNIIDSRYGFEGITSWDLNQAVARLREVEESQGGPNRYDTPDGTVGGLALHTVYKQGPGREAQVVDIFMALGRIFEIEEGVYVLDPDTYDHNNNGPYPLKPSLAQIAAHEFRHFGWLNAIVLHPHPDREVYSAGKTRLELFRRSRDPRVFPYIIWGPSVAILGV